MADDQQASESVAGWVSSVSPLRVIAEGSTVAIPAVPYKGASYSVNDLVQLTLRNPSMPVVQGGVEDDS